MPDNPLAYCPKCPPKIEAGVPSISVEHLSARYPGSDSLALEDVNLKVHRGTRVALLGPNGAGKSTLLKTLVGILPIKSGEISILGHPLGDCHHQVAYLPQRAEIDWEFPITVYKLALSGSYIHMGWLKRPTKEYRQKALQSLKLLGLENVKDRLIGQLSVGQQQRTLLARALVHDAELFILDEPFNAVDVETQQIMKDVFDDLRKASKTVLVATHTRHHLEEEFDDAIFINNGKTVKSLHFEH